MQAGKAAKEEILVGDNAPIVDHSEDLTREFSFGGTLDKITRVSKEKSNEIFRNSLQGLRTSPYYLMEGLKYAFTNLYIWQSLIIPAVTFAVVSLSVFLILLVFLYAPQVVFLNNWVEDEEIVSEVYSFYLIEQETKFLVNIIFMVVLDVVRRSIYDQMFEREAKDVKHYRKLSDVPTKERLVIVMYSVLTTVLLDIITAPLLTIPIGGKVLIAATKGWAVAWMYQAAFLASKGLSYKNQLKWVFKRFVAYELFGFVAALLLFIPILSWVFYWTNLCGAAMWAISISRATEEYMEKIAELSEETAESEAEDAAQALKFSEKDALLKVGVL